MTQRIPETTIGIVCGKHLAGNLKDDTRVPGFICSPMISRYPGFWWLLLIPSDSRNLSPCPATQQTHPSRTSFFAGARRWRRSRRSRPDKWQNYENMLTAYNRRTTTYGPTWSPIGPIAPIAETNASHQNFKSMEA